MNIRPLTDKEIAKSKTAKNTANTVIRAQQKELTRKINKLRKTAYLSAYAHLIEEREALRTITGNPVIITINNDTICLDYEILRKLDKLLNWRWYREAKIEKSTLIITYQKSNGKGVFSLNELPKYQTNLLSKLPIVEIGS